MSSDMVQVHEDAHLSFTVNEDGKVVVKQRYCDDWLLFPQHYPKPITPIDIINIYFGN